MAKAFKGERPSWSNTAFLVEALILLVVLIASMAVFTTLFSYSASRSADAERLSSAVTVAQNAAEEFSSNPQGVSKNKFVGEGVAKNGDGKFQVTCDVTESDQGTGTLYTAHISVSDSEGEAYAIDASRYVSGGEHA